MRVIIDWCFFTGNNYSFLVTAQDDCPTFQVVKGEKLKLKFFDKFNKASQFEKIVTNRTLDIELSPNPSSVLVNGFTVKFFSCKDIQCGS